MKVVQSHSASPETSVNWTRDDHLDLIFTFGGDGTILRAARYAGPLQVPLVGINLGRVGFLTELNPWQVRERLHLFLSGKYWLEKRAMLRAELWRDGELVDTFLALNDTVVARAALSRVVNCTLLVNDHRVTTYVADGVNGLRVLELVSANSTPGAFGFSPKPSPKLIATYRTSEPALSISKGLDRDRAVDESGNQIAVFGRRGGRPFTLPEMQRLFMRRDRNGALVPWTVPDGFADQARPRPATTAMPLQPAHGSR